MDVFVPEPPRTVYPTDALLGGFDADDPLSWTTTLDGRAFRAFVAAGRRHAPRDVARRQAEHDAAVTSGLDEVLAGRRPVAIMGGHQLTRDDPAYEAVARIARDLTRADHVVLSGGGPGAMEAAHLGARLADADEDELARRLAALAAPETARFPLTCDADLVSADGTFLEAGVRALHAWQVPAFELAAASPAHARTSIGIPTWLYGHEPPTPLATHHAKYFANSIREDGLLAVATHGVVYAPGSAGTLQEVYQDAAQNYYRSVDGRFSPMVFLDTDGVWTARYAVDTALRALFAPEDYDAWVVFVTDPEQVVPALLERGTP